MGNRIDIGFRDCVVPLDSLCLVGVTVYNQSLTSNITVLLELFEAYFDSQELVESFAKRATKKKVLSEVSNNDVVKTRRGQLLLDTSSSRKRTAQDMLFGLFGNRKLVSGLSLSTDVNPTESKAEIVQEEKNLLKRLKGSEELEVT